MLSIRRADLLLGGYTAPEKPSFITFRTNSESDAGGMAAPDAKQSSRWRPRRRSSQLLPDEAVAQTIAGLDFLCVCDKVRIRGRAFSAAEDPLWPPEPLSRGQRKQPLSNSYKGFGLCDGL